MSEVSNLHRGGAGEWKPIAKHSGLECSSEVQVNIQYVAFSVISYNLPVLFPQLFTPPQEVLDTR